MKRLAEEEKTQCSFRCTKQLKEDLEHFAQYSRMTEGAVIAKALEKYFHSDEGFRELMEQEDARREWYESMYDDQSDFLNFVGNRDLLIRRRTK